VAGALVGFVSSGCASVVAVLYASAPTFALTSASVEMPWPVAAVSGATVLLALGAADGAAAAPADGEAAALGAVDGLDAALGVEEALAPAGALALALGAGLALALALGDGAGAAGTSATPCRTVRNSSLAWVDSDDSLLGSTLPGMLTTMS
jgi:hypothetical protein